MTAVEYAVLSDRITGDVASLEDFAGQLSSLESVRPPRVSLDPDTIEQGVAKLVLTLVELVRRLLEKQAIRRIELGSLSDEEIERMGQTFMKLELKMAELTSVFGLTQSDLNINLGPLGDLM